jgi:hypothetical protein
MLLIEHANGSEDRGALAAAQRWSARDLTPLVEGDSDHQTASARLVYRADG